VEKSGNLTMTSEWSLRTCWGQLGICYTEDWKTLSQWTHAPF